MNRRISKRLQKTLSCLLMACTLLFYSTLAGELETAEAFDIYEPDVDLSSAADQPILIHLFTNPSLLKNAAAIQRAAVEDWSSLVNVIHFVMVPDTSNLDSKTRTEIESWEVANNARIFMISSADEVRQGLGIPGMRVYLYPPNTASPWKAPLKKELTGEIFQVATVRDWLFQLMADYFNAHYENDDLSGKPFDWNQNWSKKMAQLDAEKSVPFYVKLGQDRLEKASQQTKDGMLPIQHDPPILSDDAGKLLQTAIDAFSAMEGKPDAANSNYLGVSYYLQRDYETAEKNFKQAVQQAENNTIYRLNLGLTHLQRNNRQAALELLESLDTTDNDVRKYRNLLRDKDTQPWLSTLGFLGSAGTALAIATLAGNDADDALSQVQTISPQQTNPDTPVPALDAKDLETQLTHWGDYQRFDRRSKLSRITALNLMVNAAPFTLDGVNTQLPGKWWMMGGYSGKALVFLGFGLAANGDINSAKDGERKAASDEDKLHHRGLREDATEKRKFYFANAAIDLATVGLLYLFYDPQDGLSSGKKVGQPPNPVSPPIDLSYQFDGQGNRELMAIYRKSF
jgi:tetratricopeptide (TPR) repeat protein